MYAYFALMALNLVPKGFNPLWITMAQISQVGACVRGVWVDGWVGGWVDVGE